MARVDDQHLNLPVTFRSVDDDIVPSMQFAVLDNSDLLETIFSFFEPESGLYSEKWALSPRTQQDLVNTALTCKAFVSPALNILWRSMDSIAPLFKILPTLVLVRNDYTINGAILESHIQRVDQRPIPSFIYQILASLRPRGLLPALTHLFIPPLLSSCRTGPLRILF
ncbi:hypothetical protein GALMADRAFT_150210, partial [Galerina marginata CBS 339.88]